MYVLLTELHTPGVAVAIRSQTGSVEVVIVSGATAEQFLLSVTLMVNVAVPAGAVGVPEITPVGLSVKPAGRLPDDIMKLSGAVPPEVVKVSE